MYHYSPRSTHPTGNQWLEWNDTHRCQAKQKGGLNGYHRLEREGAGYARMTLVYARFILQDGPSKREHAVKGLLEKARSAVVRFVMPKVEDLGRT